MEHLPGTLLFVRIEGDVLFVVVDDIDSFIMLAGLHFLSIMRTLLARVVAMGLMVAEDELPLFGSVVFFFLTLLGVAEIGYFDLQSPDGVLAVQ